MCGSKYDVSCLIGDVGLPKNGFLVCVWQALLWSNASQRRYSKVTLARLRSAYCSEYSCPAQHGALLCVTSVACRLHCNVTRRAVLSLVKSQSNAQCDTSFKQKIEIWPHWQRQTSCSRRLIFCFEK